MARRSVSVFSADVLNPATGRTKSIKLDVIDRDVWEKHEKDWVYCKHTGIVYRKDPDTKKRIQLSHEIYLRTPAGQDTQKILSDDESLVINFRDKNKLNLCRSNISLRFLRTSSTSTKKAKASKSDSVARKLKSAGLRVVDKRGFPPTYEDLLERLEEPGRDPQLASILAKAEAELYNEKNIILAFQPGDTIPAQNRVQEALSKHTTFKGRLVLYKAPGENDDDDEELVDLSSKPAPHLTSVSNKPDETEAEDVKDLDGIFDGIFDEEPKTQEVEFSPKTATAPRIQSLKEHVDHVIGEFPEADLVDVNLTLRTKEGFRINIALDNSQVH